MYVQYKNYFLGKTTHERFSKRAALTQSKLDNTDFTSEEKPLHKIEPDDTKVEKLLEKEHSAKKQKRGCCFNCKRMMYQKERPT